MLVVGVDGTKTGWVAVRLSEGRLPVTQLYRTFGELVEASDKANAIAVDIPIGLPTTDVRRADAAARSFIGPRSSSVFSAPPRAVLTAQNHRAASALSKELIGKGVSQQAFALRSKILEVDDLISSGDRIYEVHPEVSFCAMAKSHLPYSKKTWNGLMTRRRLLVKVGITLSDDLKEAGIVAPDDVLDAAAAAWSALRIARGEATTLPPEPEIDDRGRPIAIWF